MYSSREGHQELFSRLLDLTWIRLPGRLGRPGHSHPGGDASNPSQVAGTPPVSVVSLRYDPGGVARASLTPGYKLPSHRDEEVPLGTSPLSPCNTVQEFPNSGFDKVPAHTYPVRMANLTLSIEDELLERGRRYAQARGTSLNALVRKLLNDAVSNPDALVDAMIERLRQSSGDSKGRRISREELHRY